MSRSQDLFLFPRSTGRHPGSVVLTYSPLIERACINFTACIEHDLAGLEPSGIATSRIYPPLFFYYYIKKKRHQTRYFFPAMEDGDG